MSAGRALAAALLILLPGAAFATGVDGARLDLTAHWVGYTSLAVFVIAYAAVIMEEHIHLRKSKPVIVAAGVIWGLVAVQYVLHGDNHTVETAIQHNLLEYAELFLFLLSAMTYINTMDERGVFAAIRAWLISRGFSLRAVFWLTGLLAFFISPVADNLTTALLMSAVVMTVAKDNPKFVTVACINIVVAANAGGAFSPFGDITTLMVWQRNIIEFQEFFELFIPSLVNWLVPALIMSFTVNNTRPKPVPTHLALRHGAFVVVGLFIMTIAMAVCCRQFLHIPPVLGMMTGLGVLKFFGYYLNMRDRRLLREMHAQMVRVPPPSDIGSEQLSLEGVVQRKEFNIFISMKRAEWDTLMFFYGVLLCVGGLGLIGYLLTASEYMYVGMGATQANILIGLLSAVIDNIPVMFAVLTMEPSMSHGQWLLVTLTAGVGGSLLSIGSAAGVAVMGQARGIYTFFGHLRWIWAIALGYALSIWSHFLLNADSFQVAGTLPA